MNPHNSSKKFVIGQTDDAFYDYFSWNGWMDEIRFSKGIARWTDNFIPPLRPYGARKRQPIVI